MMKQGYMYMVLGTPKNSLTIIIIKYIIEFSYVYNSFMSIIVCLHFQEYLNDVTDLIAFSLPCLH